MPETLRVVRADEDGSYIEIAKEILKSGGLVITPTTTNYNIIGDATRNETVERIFKVKRRTKMGPLPVSLPDSSWLSDYAEIPEGVDVKVLESFLPGEISFILWQKYPFPDQLSCGLKTIAFSVTTNPIMRSLVKAMGGPIAATSANLSGQGDIFVSLEKAIEDVGSEVDLIIDGGKTEAELHPHVNNRSNTIIDLTYEQPMLCRAGWYPLDKVIEHFPSLEMNTNIYQDRLMERIYNH